VNRIFKTNDTALFRFHVGPDNLLQVIFQIIAAYFEDDCADELTNEPVFTQPLRKEVLASQPTLSRFWNRMDEGSVRKDEKAADRCHQAEAAEDCRQGGAFSGIYNI
jgi:hypothetical protein